MKVQRYAMPATGDTFADRVKLLIHKVGSVTEIARMCGFSEGVVRSWRDGHTDPSRARCVTLARTLGVSLLWLVAGEGAMQVDAVANNIAGEQSTSDTAQLDRHRSKLHNAATSLQASGMAMDAERLNTALTILQSELDLSQSRLSLAESADLLVELYGLLGPGGQSMDARAMVAFNHRLAERIRQTRSSAAA